MPEGVFAKILDGMMTGVLDEVATVNAISAFSSHCTEEEWTSWYRPVLEKRLRIPVTITEFNKAAPKEYRIEGVPTLSSLVPVAQAKGLPQKFVLEPYRDAQRLLVMLQQGKSWVFLEDGTPVHRMLPTVFERFATEDGAILELYEEKETLVARDLMLWSQFLEEVPCPPVDIRLQVLERMLAGQDAVEMVDYQVCDGSSIVRDDIQAIFQSGYPGVIFRAMECGYWHEHANILVHPKRKSVLTCTRIDEAEEGSKYEGRTEYVWGKGRMNNKTFESPVFHGLTFAERETILQERDERIGRKFDVLSCGLDSNNKLIFPVLQRWKE